MRPVTAGGVDPYPAEFEPATLGSICPDDRCGLAPHRYKDQPDAAPVVAGLDSRPRSTAGTGAHPGLVELAVVRHQRRDAGVDLHP